MTGDELTLYMIEQKGCIYHAREAIERLVTLGLVEKIEYGELVKYKIKSDNQIVKVLENFFKELNYT